MKLAGEHHDVQDMNWADYIDALRNSAWERLNLPAQRRRGAAPPYDPGDAPRDASTPPKGGGPG